MARASVKRGLFCPPFEAFCTLGDQSRHSGLGGPGRQRPLVTKNVTPSGQCHHLAGVQGVEVVVGGQGAHFGARRDAIMRR